MKLAFFKGKGTAINAAIRLGHLLRWGQKTPYSHVELVFDTFGGDDRGRYECFSSSAVDGTPPRKDGTRFIRMALAPHLWDVLDVPGADDIRGYADAQEIEGWGYDWRGVWRFAVPVLKQHPHDFFCSEACLHVLQAQGILLANNKQEKVEPHRYSPGRLHRLVQDVYGPDYGVGRG